MTAIDSIETLILSNLIHNCDYVRRVIPFIKGEYFTENIHKIIYKEISEFTAKYSSPPSKEAIINKSVDLYKAVGGYIHRPSFVDVVPTL